MKRNVLILCTRNSCRSQITEGLLRNYAGDLFEVYSAGTNPEKAVNSYAIKVMNEIGIDISNQKPKNINEFLGIVKFSYIIVVCDRASKECPIIWPGVIEIRRIYWPIDDPTDIIDSEENILEAFRKIRDEIKAKILDWIKIFK